MPRRLSSLNFSFFGRKGFCTLKSVRLRKNAGPTAVPAAGARCVGASCCAGSAAGISTGRASARIAFRPSLARSLRPVRPCSEWRGKRDTIPDILYIPRGRGGAAHAHFGAARRGRAAQDREEAERLKRRIAELQVLRRQSSELAELTKRYYERNYHRDERYTL